MDLASYAEIKTSTRFPNGFLALCILSSLEIPTNGSEMKNILPTRGRSSIAKEAAATSSKASSKLTNPDELISRPRTTFSTTMRMRGGASPKKTAENNPTKTTEKKTVKKSTDAKKRRHRKPKNVLPRERSAASPLGSHKKRHRVRKGKTEKAVLVDTQDDKDDPSLNDAGDSNNRKRFPLKSPRHTVGLGTLRLGDQMAPKTEYRESYLESFRTLEDVDFPECP